MTTDAPTSTALRTDPTRIVVPRQRGQVLVEPPMDALVAAPAVFPNPAEADFLGMPRWAIAETARGQWLDAINLHNRAIGAAELPRKMEDLPWIVTGHQIEFYHAGVWAKVVAADHIAAARNGFAVDILVDHDVLYELGFDAPVPVPGQEKWQRTAITWAESTSLTADALASPTIEQFEHWDSELGDIPATHVDTLGHILADLRPRGEGADEPYAIWMSRARHRLEHAMGLKVAHVPTSAVCSGNTWLLFVLAWIRNAPAWTEVYNQQLAAYRTRAGIKSPMHPMPDLARRQTKEGCWEIELPFWIYTIGQPRSRLILRTTPTTSHLLHHDDPIDLAATNNPSAWESVQGLIKALRLHNVIIRPRALTLTMYVRLFIADLFIHGIGGALYDQITDGIMQQLWGIATPYGCVSAAWLLPLAQPPKEGASVPELLHERHHLFHNPQRGIDPFTSLKTDIAELLRDRRELVAEIAESIRLERKTAKAARAEMFQRLHAVNAALHEKVPKVLNRIDTALASARDLEEQSKVLLWREYYFALHSMENLQRLMDKVRGS